MASQLTGKAQHTYASLINGVAKYEEVKNANLWKYDSNEGTYLFHTEG